MYQHILVPFDDSQAALLALVEACKMGRLTGGVLHIVHVVDLAQFSWSGASFLRSEELAMASADNQPEPAFLLTKPYQPATLRAAISQVLFFDESTVPA